MVFNTTFNNILVTMYIMAVSFIGGRNRSIRRTPSTCCQSLTTSSQNVVSNTPCHERDSNGIGTDSNYHVIMTMTIMVHILLIKSRSIHKDTIVSSLFLNWSVFSSFHNNIYLIISWIEQILKNMIWLIDVAFIINNHWLLRPVPHLILFYNME